MCGRIVGLAGLKGQAGLVLSTGPTSGSVASKAFNAEYRAAKTASEKRGLGGRDETEVEEEEDLLEEVSERSERAL